MSAGNPAIAPQEGIRVRAYEMYSARGRADGKDLDDWLTAVRELTERNGVFTPRMKASIASLNARRPTLNDVF
jgi:hypothetical protein